MEKKCRGPITTKKLRAEDAGMQLQLNKSYDVSIHNPYFSNLFTSASLFSTTFSIAPNHTSTLVPSPAIPVRTISAPFDLLVPLTF